MWDSVNMSENDVNGSESPDDDRGALAEAKDLLKSTEVSSKLLSSLAASSNSWTQALSENSGIRAALNEVLRLNIDWAGDLGLSLRAAALPTPPVRFPTFKFQIPNLPSESSWAALLESLNSRQLSPQWREFRTEIGRLQQETARAVAKLNRPRFALSTQEFIATAQELRYTSSRTVWHYTSGIALMQILTQGRLWASSPHHLNDASEVSHGIEIIRHAVTHSGVGGQAGGDITSKIWNQVLDPQAIGLLMNEIYFISASGSDDSLTLWRNYAAGDGFAIGLDPREDLSADGFPQPLDAMDEGATDGTIPRINGWYKVHYMPGQKRKLAREFVQSARRDIQRAEGQDSSQLVIELRKHVLLLASTMKHDAFRDEREVRWMTTNWMPIDQVHYEHARTAIVPVLHVRSISHSDQPALLPIRGVRCSPVSAPTITRTIEGLLRQKGYEKAGRNVKRSILPFKG